MLAFLTRQAYWLIIFGILATAGGCLSAYYLPSAWQKADAIAQEPQSMPLQELATRGLGARPHVTVTDFTCGSNYAFELQARKGEPPPTPDQTGFGKAWIPLFPKSPADNPDVGPSPKRFVVLLETSPTLASGTGFHMLSRKQSIEGLAMPLSRRPLKPEIRRYLAEGYPDTDFESCLLVVQYEPYEKEDAPFFATVLAVCTGAGLAVGLPALAFGIIVQRRQRKKPRSSRSADSNSERAEPDASADRPRE